MSRAAFLAAYEAALIRSFAWAREDSAKLARFMAQVAQSCRGEASQWTSWGAAVAQDTWLAIGGKGRVTIKALRALPA